MFGPKIKTDPVTTFRKAIDAAIGAADRGVSTAEVAGYLRSRATALEDQNYRGSYTPPRMYDGSTGKLIDYNAMAEEARAARQRRIDAASEIPRDKRQHVASGYRAP
jgi:hypothetical protein